MLHVLAVLMGVTLAVTLAAAEPVEIVAHRGASWDAPENTVAAWRLAWEQGADAAELDTYLTKDGKMVVLHDGSTQRTTGVDLRVAETTLAELRALDAGKWKGEQFAGRSCRRWRRCWRPCRGGSGRSSRSSADRRRCRRFTAWCGPVGSSRSN